MKTIIFPRVCASLGLSVPSWLELPVMGKDNWEEGCVWSVGCRGLGASFVASYVSRGPSLGVLAASLPWNHCGTGSGFWLHKGGAVAWGAPGVVVGMLGESC